MLGLFVAGLAGDATAASDFQGAVSEARQGFEDGKKQGKEWFKSKDPTPQVLLDVTQTTEDVLITTFHLNCAKYGKVGFSDASHYADPRVLKAWKLSSKPPAGAVGVSDAPIRFHASWSAKPGEEAADVVVTCSELRQRVYEAGAVKERAVKFGKLAKEVKNADVAGLLQALADEWAAANPGAVVQKPAKKSVGVAKWFASVTAKAADSGAVSRRDWYAWETQGVSALVQGTTWVATVCYTATAAADAKTAAVPEELLKNLGTVVK